MPQRSSEPSRRSFHAPGKSKPGLWTLPHTVPVGVLRGLLGIFLVATLASTALSLAAAAPTAGWGWFEGVVGVSGAALVVASLGRRVPLQSALACGLVVFLTSGMTLAVATHTRFPLGRVEFTEALGPRLLGLVAWPAPFLWVAVLLSSRQSAKVILRPWRRHRYYGWLLLGVAVLLAVLLAAALDPFGHGVKGWWTWYPRADGMTWFGAPLAFLPATAVLAAGLLLCATPWLIPKRPTGQPPEVESVVVWLALAIWSASGCLRGGLVVPGVVGLAGGVAVAWFAWRGKQAVITPAGAPAAAPASAA